jgi:hypothetical protein
MTGVAPGGYYRLPRGDGPPPPPTRPNGSADLRPDEVCRATGLTGRQLAALREHYLMISREVGEVWVWQCVCRDARGEEPLRPAGRASSELRFAAHLADVKREHAPRAAPPA